MPGKMLIFAVFVISGGIALMLLSVPAAAQVATVTPLPGPVATATAAAQQMSAAQQAKAQAAQQAQAAQAKAADADAQFNAAAQAANDARAALAAQQIGAASEALGRAEAAIGNGKDRLSELSGVIDGQSKTIGNQADQIAALTQQVQRAQGDLQQERIAKQQALAAYEATQSKLAEANTRFSVDPAIAILGGAFLLVLIVVFVAWKWSQPPKPQTVPAAPPIDVDYTVDISDDANSMP